MRINFTGITIPRPHIPEGFKTLFFPPENSQEMTLNSALKSLDSQRIARITKTALYILATITITSTVVMAELAIIAIPLMLASLGVAILAAAIFYRLNTLDQKYIGGLTDPVRCTIVKNELNSLLIENSEREAKATDKTLLGINRLIGQEIFDKKYRQNAISGTFAPINFSKEWKEHGRFNLKTYTYNATLNWSGVRNDPVTVTFTKKEVKTS